MAPWAVRNARLTDAFVPVSTWGWAPMYHGTQVAKRMTEWRAPISAAVDDEATHHVREEFARTQGPLDTDPANAGREAVRYDRFAQHLTLEEWRGDPVGLAERGLLGLLFSVVLRLRREAAPGQPGHAPAAAGAVRRRRRASRESFRSGIRARWPALGLMLFVNAFHAIAFPHVRYMSPAIALSFAFAALPAAEILECDHAAISFSKKRVNAICKLACDTREDVSTITPMKRKVP